MPARVLYLDWIYDVGRANLFAADGPTEIQKEIIGRVRDAVEQLSPIEREFVQLHWFEGRSLAELSELFGKRPHNLDGINRRILKKLRRSLSSYVTERFGVVVDGNRDCVVCRHPQRCEIDELLLDKKPHETFRPIYGELRDRFNLNITTPQILIGHMKYHMKARGNDD